MIEIILSRYKCPCGELILGSCGDEVCICDWLSAWEKRDVTGRLSRKYDTQFISGTSNVIEGAKKELDEYFAGKRKAFDIPLKLIGTEFQCRIWNTLQEIPYGEIITYSYLATSISESHAVRAVANAVGANLLSIFIPCHRVIGRNGKLTGYRGGIEAKSRLLELERDVKKDIG